MIKKYITFHWQRLVRGQQKFDLHDVLNPVQIEINNDRILNILKKHENIHFKLTPIGILFPSSVKNDTKQIFATCRELNNAKTALINRKIVNILGIVNLNKINNWEHIKGKSLWVNINFDDSKKINIIDHLPFSFETLSLNDMLGFSINLIDDDNKPIEFNSGETKISILNFKIEVFLKWTEN